MRNAHGALPHRANQGADARVAEVETTPDQRGDENREERVREQRIVDPEVRDDGAAEVPGPEHGAEGRDAGDEVEDEADRADDADREDLVGGETELSARFGGGLRHDEL